MEKLRIAICDNIPIVASVLENYLGTYPKCSFECDCFTKSRKLIDALQTTHYDIYLLEAVMCGNNGLDVARAIRKKDLDAYLIFVTSHAEYMKEAFQFNTFDYLLKPINKSQLYQVIDRILLFNEKRTDTFCYLKGHNQFLVSLNDVLYFEKSGRYVVMRTKNGMDKFILSTNELLKRLNRNFIQIHASFIVNLNYLKMFSNKQVVLSIVHEPYEETIELPISRRFSLQVQESINQFTS
ncbi:hypothetical protein IGI37_003428 [Enterococcus sp. AZ194]|uniref:LytR/AlgR family response regulator transcription factor n=1 Tax=Enterococcus sp. AZ194 TaxID=2774629 RepID=UPI003F274DA2